jgi:putative peptidoglycan lipid II flippase
VRYATISIGVNLAANLILIPYIGHIGPPLATALAALVNVTMLYVTLRKRGHFEADAQLLRRLPRLALAAILMGAAIFGLDRLLDPYLTGTLVMRILGLGVLVAGGTAIYGVACFVTRAFTLGDIKALVRKRRPSDPIQE